MHLHVMNLISLNCQPLLGLCILRFNMLRSLSTRGCHLVKPRNPSRSPSEIPPKETYTCGTSVAMPFWVIPIMANGGAKVQVLA